MSKTNFQRATNILRGRVSVRMIGGMKRIEGPYDEVLKDISKALDKAERRGAKNGVSCQPCSCPKCGEQLIMPRMIVKQEVKPQFDVDEVRGLINILEDKVRECSHVYFQKRVLSTRFMGAVENREAARSNLLSALGIDE